MKQPTDDQLLYLMETAAENIEHLHELGITDERARTMFLALAIRLANRDVLRSLVIAAKSAADHEAAEGIEPFNRVVRPGSYGATEQSGGFDATLPADLSDLDD